MVILQNVAYFITLHAWWPIMYYLLSFSVTFTVYNISCLSTSSISKFIHVQGKVLVNVTLNQCNLSSRVHSAVPSSGTRSCVTYKLVIKQTGHIESPHRRAMTNVGSLSFSKLCIAKYYWAPLNSTGNYTYYRYMLSGCQNLTVF